MEEHFSAKLKHLEAGDVCGVGSGFVVEEAGGAVIRALVLNVTAQAIQLLAFQLDIAAIAGWRHF